MRFWPFTKKKRVQEQGEDLDAALQQADRALEDAQAQRQRADDVVGRLVETWGRNHIAQAVIDSLKRT